MTGHRSILAIGLALKAIEHGHRTYFLTLYDLVNKVRLAHEKNRLHVLHATLQRADIWLLDELGFQPLGEDATFLFEAVNKRYAAGKSTIITSNKSCGQWYEIFPDPVRAVALRSQAWRPEGWVGLPACGEVGGTSRPEC